MQQLKREHVTCLLVSRRRLDSLVGPPARPGARLACLQRERIDADSTDPGRRLGSPPAPATLARFDREIGAQPLQSLDASRLAIVQSSTLGTGRDCQCCAADGRTCLPNVVAPSSPTPTTPTAAQPTLKEPIDEPGCQRSESSSRRASTEVSRAQTAKEGRVIRM